MNVNGETIRLPLEQVVNCATRNRSRHKVKKLLVRFSLLTLFGRGERFLRLNCGCDPTYAI
jgi:hypothetical protein